MNDEYKPPYVDSLSECQLQMFGQEPKEPRPPKRPPGNPPKRKTVGRTALDQSPPPAVMAASRGPQAAKHRLELKRRRKITGAHAQRSANLIKARTKRAKK